jgi:hypothetical protein
VSTSSSSQLAQALRKSFLSVFLIRSVDFVDFALLAGTGHEGPSTGSGEALTVKEHRPDGSMWETRYDGFGDARVMLDGLQRQTLQGFDKMGRVIQITRPETLHTVSPGVTATGSLVERYAYDGLGQRLRA